MGIAIVRGVEITRPSTTPLKSSILDHATVVENSHFGIRNNEGLWPSYNCLDTLSPTTLCPDPLSESPYKEFSGGAWQPAFEFAVYGGVQCSAVGLDVEDMRSEVRRVFGLNQGKGIERALLNNRFIAQAAGSDDLPLWGSPDNLTPTPVPLHVALALLEGYAAANYAGQVTIHMPRAAASVLNERIVWVGDKAFTRLGSKIAIGGGYDLDEPTAAWDLYATGEVYIERSEEINVSAFTLPGDGSGIGSDQNGLSSNTQIALAERMFRVAIDCFAAKATGLIPVAPSGGGGSTLVDNGDGTWSEV